MENVSNLLIGQVGYGEKFKTNQNLSHQL